MSPSLSFQVLGSLKVSVDGRPLTLRSARQRAVLAVLLLTPGRVVSVQTLAEAVWHSDPPTTVRNQIAICVSALRKTLRDDAGVDGLIETVLPGYVLHAEGHYVDLIELERCSASARAAAEAGAAAAAGRFQYALSLWSGPVLDGMDGGAIGRAASRLTELRLDLTEELAALLLQQGRYRAVIEDLAPVVAEHPLREQARAVLMQAYHLSGRRSDALECYRAGRRILVAELGVEPGAELQEIHRKVLEGERPRDAGRERAPTAPPAAIPRQLPLPPDPFIGRQGELDLLDRLLEPADGRPPVRVAEISGVPGVGKSALAMLWANRRAERFPDGQLFIDLQGFHEHGVPVPPEAALDRALRALGVTAAAIPTDLRDRAELYRSTLEGKRLLVVLDNAGSPAQVRPLLPPPGPARVLVTSREPLSGPAGEFAAIGVELREMEEAEALDMLVAMLGEERVAAEPGAAQRLVELCDRLPLALRVVATRLLADHRWTLRQLVGRMEDRRDRLDVAGPGEGGVSSGAWLGYRTLSVRAARLCRHLGMLGVCDFPAWVGAAVLGVTPRASEELLRELAEAQFLEVCPAPGGRLHFRFQDAMRSFARERCLAEDSPQERRESLERVLGAMLALVHAAQEQLYGKGEAVPRGVMHGDVLPGDTVSELVGDPIEWFEDEREALVSLVRQAAQSGLAGHAWALTVRSVPFFETRNHLEDWRRTAEYALEGAQREGDTLGAGTMLRSLGTLAIYQRRYEEARDRLLSAMFHLEQSDDTQGRAIVRRNLAVCARFSGELAEAARYCEESLVLFRRTGDFSGLSHALGLLAQIEIEQGEPERGVELSNQAIEASYQGGSLRSRTQNLYRLAEALLGAGQPAQAERVCHDVVALTRGQGDRLGEAHGLCVLGETQWRQDEAHKARASLLLALRAAEEVKDCFLQARITTNLACVEAIRGGSTAEVPLEWAQQQFRTLNAQSWVRRAGLLQQALASRCAGRPIDGSALARLLDAR